MFKDSDLNCLLWEGFSVHSFSEHGEWLHLHLTSCPNHQPRCRSCLKPASRIHDISERQVRDRDLLHYRVLLHVPVARVLCNTCGPRTQAISWLKPNARQTKRLQHYAQQLSERLPIKHVAELLDLSWHTVQKLDKQRLQRDVQPPDWRNIRRLVMDEFALFKGHRYATVVADADTHQVLWIGEGRSRIQIRPFFEQLGEHCHQIEAVAMDMNTAFDLEVQQHCPNAVVVYDLFHVIAKYGREVIDRVRVDEANRLRADKRMRRGVKRARWLLLKNRENLTDQQHTQLDELLSVNRNLMVVYVLKAQLKALWYCAHTAEATQLWAQWWQQVQESGIKPLKEFARKLKPYLHGIVASAQYPLHTSRLEGINNKIKVIKRMAYGYRDTEYFFLKIKGAFPGNRR